jgi:hypothetical protein
MTYSAASLSHESHNYDTLDEPVLTTIWRDLRLIGIKIRHVLLPTDITTHSELKNWDLWGRELLLLFTYVFLIVFLVMMLYDVSCTY